MASVVQGERPSTIGRAELLEFGIPFGAAVVGTSALFTLTPLAGPLGFVIVSYAIFLGLYYVAARRLHGRVAGVDRVVTVAISTAALVTVVPLILIIGYVIQRGLHGLSANFFTKTLEGVDPSAPPTTGGALHAITGTLTQVGFATLVAVPFGIATAVYLNEIGGRLVPIVRLMVDAMSGIPSIVAGLFIYAVWVVGLGQGFSGFAASLALGILMLPTVARTTEEMLRLVDPSLREASLALGSPQWRTVAQVVLPTARTGIVTAVILGIARVAGETAPLLMTAFGADKVVGPVQALHQPQSSLPLFVFQQLAQDQRERAWAGALVLIGIVLVLFVIARIVGRAKNQRSR